VVSAIVTEWQIIVGSKIGSKTLFVLIGNCQAADLIAGSQSLGCKPCDHCNLCSVAAPLIPPDTTLVADFGPTRTLQVLYPPNIACKGDVIADSRSARGPPAFA
jgi:hypothetical protein